MSFEKRLSDIRSLKTQGATNVAVSGIEALKEFSSSIKSKNGRQYLEKLSKAAAKISNVRSTEPMLRNFLNYVMIGLKDSDLSNVKRLKLLTKQLSGNVIRLKSNAKQRLVEIGKNEVKNNSILYTHCHSSSVTSILIAAKKSGKKFSVINTETRPMFQGRLTANELSKAKIKLTHYVDSGMRLAIKKSDAVFLGADSISALGVDNKIGSGLVCELAKNYDVPVFICAHSFKINPLSLLGKEDSIEQRPSSEVWQKAPKGVKIENPSFELNAALLSRCQVVVFESLSLSQMRQLIDRTKIALAPETRDALVTLADGDARACGKRRGVCQTLTLAYP